MADAGKGDRYRDVDKKKYDETWIRVFGKLCENCDGTGSIRGFVDADTGGRPECPICHGLGKVDRK